LGRCRGGDRVKEIRQEFIIDIRVKRKHTRPNIPHYLICPDVIRKLKYITRCFNNHIEVEANHTLFNYANGDVLERINISVSNKMTKGDIERILNLLSLRGVIQEYLLLYTYPKTLFICP
jgi:hypothetical protein